MTRRKLRVGVLFGGRSGEHEISLRSALTVMSAMDPSRYDIVPIGISRDGRWFLRDDAIKLRVKKKSFRSTSILKLTTRTPIHKVYSFDVDASHQPHA